MKRGGRAAFEIGEASVPAGTRVTVDLPVSVLSNHTPINLPVCVVHGRRDGPVLFVSAAIHGDEIIGVEIIRRLLGQPALGRLRGTLMAIPVVNAYGFIGHSRYLPDRRDLNRSFPGSERGSLAGRLAHLFLQEVVSRADFGIDLHSAAIHRTNLPQIRTCGTSARSLEMAHIFGAPLIVVSALREGSLRLAAREIGVDVLVYEAGEGLRFDETAIRGGVAGVLRVMKAMGMLASARVKAPRTESLIAERSYWVRAVEGGILRAYKAVGESVVEGDMLGRIGDPFGEVESDIKAPSNGLIIGRTNLPVVNQGDALFHIARTRMDTDLAEARVEEVTEALSSDPLFDEDEII